MITCGFTPALADPAADHSLHRLDSLDVTRREQQPRRRMTREHCDERLNELLLFNWVRTAADQERSVLFDPQRRPRDSALGLARQGLIELNVPRPANRSGIGAKANDSLGIAIGLHQAQSHRPEHAPIERFYRPPPETGKGRGRETAIDHDRRHTQSRQIPQ
jgi:hypothetical protein